MAREIVRETDVATACLDSDLIIVPYFLLGPALTPPPRFSICALFSLVNRGASSPSISWWLSTSINLSLSLFSWLALPPQVVALYSGMAISLIFRLPVNNSSLLRSPQQLLCDETQTSPATIVPNEVTRRVSFRISGCFSNNSESKMS